MKKEKRQQRLPEQVKRFIVVSLATYETPSRVAASCLAEFGVVVTRQAVQRYAPDSRAGSKLSPDLQQLHRTTRATYNRDLDSIAVRQMAWRLRTLQRLVEQAEEKGEIALAADLLRQAACEVGGRYTNQYAAKIETTPTAHPEEPKTREEKAQLFMQLIGRAEPETEDERDQAIYRRLIGRSH